MSGGTRAKSGQFRQGRSGNPQGRPKKPASNAQGSAFDIFFGRTLTMTQNGRSRELTMEEALELQTLKNAFAGKLMAQRVVLKMIAKREAWLARHFRKPTGTVSIGKRVARDPANADAAMLLLGIAARDPARQDFGADREQLKLEPWAVQAALSRRRGGEKLSDKDIFEIRRCTSDAKQLQWPRGTRA